MQIPPFHLAFPIKSITDTRAFYIDILGCEEGRSTDNWIDFGAVLEWQQWHDLADRLKDAGVAFLLAPKIRFVGEPGEQGTFFVTDPAGNGLEFKTFRDPAMIFAH